MTIPKLKILQDVLFIEKKCLNFFLENNIIKRPEKCKSCNSKMNKARKLLYKCSNKECKRAISLFDNTFFSNQHLKCNDILFLSYLWLSKVNYTSIANMTSFSSTTIIRYIKIFRELVINDINEEDMIIGGPNIIVEL